MNGTDMQNLFAITVPECRKAFEAHYIGKSDFSAPLRPVGISLLWCIVCDRDRNDILIISSPSGNITRENHCIPNTDLAVSV